MIAGLLLDDSIEIGGGLAQRGMRGDETIGDRTQQRIGFPGGGQLIAERLALPALAVPGHSDSEGLENAADMPFEILTETDQPFPSAHQDTQAIRPLAADMNRREPAGARELGQPFRIAGIGFVETGRQALVRLAGINTGRGQSQSDHPAL